MCGGHHRWCERLKFFVVLTLKIKWHRNKELTAVEFEPGTPGSEITELPTKPQGSWRVQVIEKAICLWFLFFYVVSFFYFLMFFFYFIFCLFWKNSKPIRSCFLGSTSHRNLRALPERSALGCASGTTLGQRAQISMLGRTSDAASNINLIWLRPFLCKAFCYPFEKVFSLDYSIDNQPSFRLSVKLQNYILVHD